MTGEQEQVLLIRQADQRGAHQRPCVKSNGCVAA